VARNRSRDPLKQCPQCGTIDPVALHNETDKGIVHQFSKRTLGDVHNLSPQPFREPAQKTITELLIRELWLQRM